MKQNNLHYHDCNIGSVMLTLTNNERKWKTDSKVIHLISFYIDINRKITQVLNYAKSEVVVHFKTLQNSTCSCK